jgi:hypothetical protein
VRIGKGISGIVLVGALPMHRFFMHEHANPHPVFYEDFDLVFIDKNTLKVEIPNDDFGDPANGIVKQLKVDYTFDGKEKSKTVKDGEKLKIDR